MASDSVSDKKRKASNSSLINDSEIKTGRYTRTPEGIAVSSILQETNSILFENDDNTAVNLSTLFNSDEENESHSLVPIVNSTEIMSTAEVKNPTNADIMKFLEKIDNRLLLVENKLETLHSLERKSITLKKKCLKCGIIFKTKVR
jgi:hypothetical protein